jgi:protein involved in polysaccharide export with SLBB domain
MGFRSLFLARPLAGAVRTLVFLAGALCVAVLPESSSLAQDIDPSNLPLLRQQLQQMQEHQSGLQTGQTNDNQQSRPVTLLPAVPAVSSDKPPSRLEMIMSSRAHAKLSQFGYDQLGTGHTVTISQAGAVQDDYVLGPGDQLSISLRGQENNEFNVTVNRNGQIVLPRLNPLAAMGRTLGSLRQDLDVAVRRAYIGTSVFVSVARVRQITVQVSGEVNSAGPRLVTGLSSVIDALLLSGGIKKTGSLRNIHVRRGNRDFTVDLYAFLTDSANGVNMRLADGDHVIVPPLGSTMAVTGLVRRPGIYELPPDRRSISVRDATALAGGEEVRGNYRLSVLRIRQDGQSQLVPVAGQNGSVGDSEILFVQLGADRTVSQATLSGGTGLAGSYPVASGTKLSDIMNAPGALGPSPYTPFGIIVRTDPQTQLRQLTAFTPVAVRNGREDLTVQGDDIVRVLSVNESRLLDFIIRAYLSQLARDQDHIRNPLAQPVNQDPNSLFGRLASESGQDAELEDISSVPAYIQRQAITALLDRPAPDSRLALEQVDRDRQHARERAMAAQQNQMDQGATTQQRQGQGQTLDRFGAAGAGIMYPGADVSPNTNRDFDQFSQAYPGDYQDMQRPDQENRSVRRQRYEEPAENFTNQIVSANGFASNREVQTFGQLARQLGIDPLILVNFLIDHRIRLDGAIRGPGSYLAGPNATLADLVQAAGGTLNWADNSGVESISTVVDRTTGRAVTGRRTLALRENTLASYVVQSHDQFRFRGISTDVGVGMVTVQGEVRYPGTFPILRGEHLSDLLARAGGLTSTAYPYGTVYLRKSAAQAERQSYSRAADEVQSQLVVAMTRIGNSKIDPSTFSAMQSFVTELRNHQALGRVSFVADPKILAANPTRDPLLEAGDVVYIPPRPNTIAVLGEVLQPGNFVFKKGATLDDYIAQAGGYAATADESHTYIVMPNGEARRVSRSWLSVEVVDLPPGSSIVAPRDVTPLDLRQTIIDVSQIFSQFAVSIASIAVLSRQ